MSLSQKQLHWQALVEQQSQSGLSNAEFCQQQDIKLATFYYWAKKLRINTVQQHVLPIIVDDEFVPQQVVITSASGLQIALPANLPKAQIRHWLEALA